MNRDNLLRSGRTLEQQDIALIICTLVLFNVIIFYLISVLSYAREIVMLIALPIR